MLECTLTQKNVARLTEQLKCDDVSGRLECTTPAAAAGRYSHCLITADDLHFVLMNDTQWHSSQLTQESQLSHIC